MWAENRRCTSTAAGKGDVRGPAFVSEEKSANVAPTYAADAAHHRRGDASHGRAGAAEAAAVDDPGADRVAGGGKRGADGGARGASWCTCAAVLLRDGVQAHPQHPVRRDLPDAGSASPSAPWVSEARLLPGAARAGEVGHHRRGQGADDSASQRPPLIDVPAWHYSNSNLSSNRVLFLCLWVVFALLFYFYLYSSKYIIMMMKSQFPRHITCCDVWMNSGYWNQS